MAQARINIKGSATHGVRETHASGLHAVSRFKWHRVHCQCRADAVWQKPALLDSRIVGLRHGSEEPLVPDLDRAKLRGAERCRPRIAAPFRAATTEGRRT